MDDGDCDAMEEVEALFGREARFEDEGEVRSTELFLDDGLGGRATDRKVPIGGCLKCMESSRRLSRFKDAERDEREEHSDSAEPLVPHVDPPRLWECQFSTAECPNACMRSASLVSCGR